MFNLLAALFRAPWWLFVGLAALAYFGGDYIYQDMKAEKEARLAALEAPMPEVVDLSEFSARNIPVSDEVHLKGWVNFDLNHHLTVRKKGRMWDERYVFILFGSDDATGAKTARAALFFTEDEREKFLAHLDQYITGYDGGRPLIQINGFGGEYESFEDQLGDALAKREVVLGPDFIAIHPFLEGRETGLKTGGNPEGFKDFGLNTALALLAIAVLKFFVSLFGRKAKASFADGPIASGASRRAASSLMVSPSGTTNGNEAPRDLMPLSPASAPRSDAVTDDSPLGRMQRRDQELRVAAMAPQAPSTSLARTAPIAPTDKLWTQFKKSAVFVLTCVLLLIWAGNKMRLLDLGDAGDILRWGVSAMVFVCMGFGAWFLMTRKDFAGGNPIAKIAVGLGGLFLLGQIQGFLGAAEGGSLMIGVVPLAAMFLFWAFVIRRFTHAIGRGVDKAAAAAVQAKLKADPYDKLARQSDGPIQTLR